MSKYLKKSFFSKLFNKIYNPKFLNLDRRYQSYSIGDFTYGKPTILSWGENTTLIIGKFCSISEDVTILLGGEHNTNWISTYPFNQMLNEVNAQSGHPKSKGIVEIGNDVWIGNGATILSGVKIGNGAVIGARSLVAKDVLPYTIVAGNPAKFIRLRFTEEQINNLLKIKWWDWPVTKIKVELPTIMSTNIDEFIDKYS